MAFSRKTRERMWWVIGAAAIIGVGALAYNTQFTPGGDYQYQTGRTGEEQTNQEQKPAASTPAPKTSDVYMVADGLSDGGVFSALLANTGVSSYLQAGGQYTIFLPTNEAMRRIDTSGMTAAQKKQLAQYHIIPDRAVDADALRSGNVRSLSGDLLNFTVLSDGQIRVNSSRIISQHAAKNGIVYLIDNVLLPPKKAW